MWKITGSCDRLPLPHAQTSYLQFLAALEDIRESLARCPLDYSTPTIRAIQTSLDVAIAIDTFVIDLFGHICYGIPALEWMILAILQIY